MTPSRTRHVTPADASGEAAGRASFPASDPGSTSGELGARAVPVEEMMGACARPEPQGVVVSRRFATLEAAKLALEGLVRDAPIDRCVAEVTPAGAAAWLHLRVPAAEAPRLQELLDLA